MKKTRKFVAAILAMASLLSVTACGGSGGRTAGGADATEASTTTAPQTTPVTYDTDEAVQEAITNIEVDTSLKPEKKLKWMAWWPIDETSAEAELFKANYGIPEEGDTSYGDYANSISQYINVAYRERYDKLGNMVAAGDSPDVFPFEIGYFPLSAYKGMFQSVDGIIDTNAPEWADTRDVMDQFMWGGKNYCPITQVNTSYLFFYRRSVAQDAGLEDPYELYKAGEWTWDKFLEMADKFQQSGEGRSICDGYYVSRSLLCTTGVPLVGIENGKLKNNMSDPAVESAMALISKLAEENYRYDKGSLNSWAPNIKEWGAGNILFMVDGTWFYEETAQKYMRKFEWGEDDIFFVPAPRDPNSDKYYQEMKVDPYMLVSGSSNIDTYKAWINCVLAASKDADAKAAQREKNKRDKYWTDEQLDYLDELTIGGALTAVFDFRNGISTSCADTTSGNAPTDIVINHPYNAPENSYTQLRSEHEGEVNAAIEELNSSVA